MKDEKFPCFPKVFRADGRSEVTLDIGNAWPDGTEFELRRLSLEQRSEPDLFTVSAVSGKIIAEMCFPGEQEHLLLLRRRGQQVGKAAVYSVRPDLFDRIPMKGDFHMHSIRSDGKDSPAAVAAFCRRIGLDIMALTDHRKYAPSLEAIEAFRDVPVDILLCPGEEVHAPKNPLHIVNFGGDHSVNELFARDEDKYFRQVREIEETLDIDIPQPEKFQYASSKWIFDRIRSGGGLGIYCHPYWVWPGFEAEQGYYISETLITALFDHPCYDAYELIGGYGLNEPEANNLQVARYMEERAKGKKIPIVGVSDAHGCIESGLFGWYYSVILSEGAGQDGVIRSIKDCCSVAVSHLPGAHPQAFGPLRLVKYAQFLLREVFPGHDDICRRQGDAMLSCLSNDPTGRTRLSELSGKAGEYIAKCFGR